LKFGRSWATCGSKGFCLEKNRHLRQAFFKEARRQVNAAVLTQGPNSINISGPKAVVLGPNAIKIVGPVVLTDEE
jgi:hypothetical protein